MTLKPEHIVEELNRTPKLKRDLIMKMMEVMLDSEAFLEAYNGWFTNSDSTNLEEKYDIEKIMRASRWSVARWSMIQNRRKAA